MTTTATEAPETCGATHDRPEGPCPATEDLSFDPLAGERRCLDHQTPDPYDWRDDEPDRD